MTDGAATKELGFAGTGPGAAEGRSTPSGAQRPLFTVVRGEPTAEQLAALIAVLGSGGGPAVQDNRPAARSTWARPVLRSPLHPGPDAWIASAWPG